MSLLRFSFQNETLILDDLLYLCKVNAVRHSYLYESSVGAREAQKRDVNTCFYYLFYNLNYLACKRGMKFISFQNNVKGTLLTDHQIFDAGGGRGGGGSFANCKICLLPLSPCSIFPGVISQHPNTRIKKSNSPSLRCYQVLQLFL